MEELVAMLDGCRTFRDVGARMVELGFRARREHKQILQDACEALLGRRPSDATAHNCLNRHFHSQRHADWMKDYRVANRSRAKERHAGWVSGHRDRFERWRAAWRAANKDRLRESQVVYREANADRIRGKKAAWYANNRERARHTSAAYHARKAGADGTHTVADLRRIFEHQDGLCVCGTDLRTIASAGRHLDHIMPLSRGGSNWPDNLQWLCQPCNDSKGAQTMEEWVASGGLRRRRSKVTTGS